MRASVLNELLAVASLIAQRGKSLPAKQETQVQSLGWENPLEKEMANYSSILAWTIPGGLQSMELQESVRHDLAAKPPLPPTTMLTSIEPRT